MKTVVREKKELDLRDFLEIELAKTNFRVRLNGSTLSGVTTVIRRKFSLGLLYESNLATVGEDFVSFEDNAPKDLVTVVKSAVEKIEKERGITVTLFIPKKLQ